MRAFLALTTIMLLACGQALAACGTVKVGYPNQNVPPYYMGAGPKEAKPPGASVELIREMLASQGCSMISVRLPPRRIIQALDSGAIDFGPASLQVSETTSAVFPLDKSGTIDRERSLRLYTVVFVRSSDKLPKDGDPARLLAGKKLAVNFGSTYADVIRKLGFDVDDGALDLSRNIDKLLRKRVDAVLIPLATPSDMDNVVIAPHEEAIMRLDKPIRQSNVWLAASKSFYDSHRELTESVWNWLGTNGHQRFSQLQKKYE